MKGVLFYSGKASLRSSNESELSIYDLDGNESSGQPKARHVCPVVI